MGRPKLLVLGALGVVALAGTGIVAADVVVWPFDTGPVEQPIAFSHELHAGANQIPCLFCHYSADISPSAGIPPVQVCAGCHLPGQAPGAAQPVVRGDRPGVKQLTRYFNEGIPVPWARIYDVPDHVRFPHMMHVNAGLRCQECHGAVETMAEVEKAQELRMGWCVECHEARAVRKDCFVCHY